MFETTDTYKLLKSAVETRKAKKVWKSPHVERYIANDFYAFTRG